MIVKATIPGRPQPKERPRHTKGGHSFTPAKTRIWESAAAFVILNAAQGQTFTGPCVVTVNAYWHRPKSCPKCIEKSAWATGEAVYRPSTPDADNILKAVLDAGNRSKVWGDDAQVVIATVSKLYAAEGDEARVVVEIRSMDN